MAALCGLAVLLVSQPARCQPLTDSIGDYLRAGEFAPALQAARRIEDPRLRDRQLARIAAGQALMGAGQASARTLLAIEDDVQRSQAVRSIGARPIGARGGAALADFDTLIELITSTIAPDTWDEVGGTGAIESFPTGVYVDTTGLLKRLPRADVNPLLEDIRRTARHDSGNRLVRHRSVLRKVSLTRLEKLLQVRHAFGRAPDRAMQLLAGIYRIRYLLVYPETGDIVLAGPAGDWRRDSQGRVVNVETGTPVLQLDDLIVLLRNAYGHDGKFGCAIKPKQENLAATKTFADTWRDKAVSPRRRQQWLSQLRDTLGKQDVQVWGIDPGTRVARIVVEADYRMKLIGMGLEEGTFGVVSYLDAVKESAGRVKPSMSVLRWWFTLNYKGIRATAAHDTFALDGQGVRVLSENELLTETGKRIHTGESDELNHQFAHSFTRHFPALATRYPIYAELRNVFDMALVTALMRAEDLPERVGWHMTYFRDADVCRVSIGPAPREVASVVNSVVVNRRQFIAGVSGGVSVDSTQLVRSGRIKTDDYGLMKAEHGTSAPRNLDPDAWWWD